MNIRVLVWTALCCALIIVGAFISIPLVFSVVPIVLQNLFVLFAGLVLSPLQAGVAVALYLGLGVLGLPIFAGGTGGVAHLLGPTGGYLIGFLPAAIICATISLPNYRRPSWVRDVLAVVIATAVIYACGVPWLAWRSGLTFSDALIAGLYPFLIADAIKAVIALLMARTVRSSEFSPYRRQRENRRFRRR